MAFPDSSSVLDKFQSASNGNKTIDYVPPNFVCNGQPHELHTFWAQPMARSSAYGVQSIQLAQVELAGNGKLNSPIMHSDAF